MRIWNFVKQPQNTNAVMAIFTVLIFLASAAYTVVALKQWSVMHDTLALERPWISEKGYVNQIAAPKEAAPPKEGTLIDWSKYGVAGVQLRVLNGGRTPASKVRWHAELVAGPVYDGVKETKFSGLPTDEVCDKGELSSDYGAGIMLPTTEPVNYFSIYPSKEIVQHGPEILRGALGMYIVGCIDYSDSSGQPWYRSRIRMAFTPRQIDPWVLTRFGNEAW
jgi:hypothetical protein